MRKKERVYEETYEKQSGHIFRSRLSMTLRSDMHRLINREKDWESLGRCGEKDKADNVTKSLVVHLVFYQASLPIICMVDRRVFLWWDIF